MSRIHPRMEKIWNDILSRLKRQVCVSIKNPKTFKSEHIKVEQGAEEFTKQFLIEPILKNINVDYYREVHRADYYLPHNKIVIEAKPIAINLHRGINLDQLAKYVTYPQFVSGFLTNGLEWIYMKKNSDRITYIDARYEYEKLEHYLTRTDDLDEYHPFIIKHKVPVRIELINKVQERAGEIGRKIRKIRGDRRTYPRSKLLTIKENESKCIARSVSSKYDDDDTNMYPFFRKIARMTIEFYIRYPFPI